MTTGTHIIDNRYFGAGVKGMLLLTLPMTLTAGLGWRDLPALPQPLAGQFVGVIGDRLVVAGGSHWTGVPKPWDGGKKIWVDTIYTLRREDRSWRLAGHLPHAMGYGVAISTPGAMLCIGGQTSDGTVSTTYRLQLRNNEVAIDQLAQLPQAASNMAGALLGDTVLVAGGQAEASSLVAMHSFWSLDLSMPHATWKVLDPWPGAAVILPIAAASEGNFYLFGGAELTGTPGPPVGRRFLRTAFRYRPGNGWEKLADLPRPAEAGFAVGETHDVLLIGGSDGVLADREFQLKDQHPGFCRDVQRYSAAARSWIPEGEMPVSLVTSGVVRWGDEWVIAGGEDRPAHRSARVLAMREK